MFQTLSQYNKTIQVEGANAFKTLKNIFFIPARTLPIKIYSFGSGSFAVVFKAIEHSKEIAIRCFVGTNGDYAERYRKIDTYLKEIKGTWKSNIEFLDNEIQVQGKNYPILKMNWVDGLLLDRYINKNIDNNFKLNELQEQFVKTSQNLEKNKISHGDIQEGNIIISEINGKPKVKLIDYDGMFIPDFEGQKQIERGRSEYQHPNRENFIFNEKIDRFSFWIILCALEALKFDKTLWKEIMQGGFNTLSNMLFCGNDFLNPNQSKLFNRLEQLNQPSVKFYLDKIKFALYNNKIDKLELYTTVNLKETHIEIDTESKVDINSTNQYARIKITSEPTGASVRNSNFERLGVTPLNLNKYDYLNKELKIIVGTKAKSVWVDENTTKIKIEFEKIITDEPTIYNEKNIEPPPLFEPKQLTKDNSYLWFGLLLLLLIFGVIVSLTNNNNKNSYSPEAITYDGEEAVVEAAAVDVDSAAAVAVDTISSINDTDKEPTLINENSQSTEKLIDSTNTVSNNFLVTNKKIRYLLYNEVGLLAFYNDFSIAGCPKCELNRLNIKNMKNMEVLGFYDIQSDGKLKAGTTTFNPVEIEDNGDKRWAVIDYFWYVEL